MGAIEDRLHELGIEIPDPYPTAGAYAPVLLDGDLAYTSGMLGVADMALAYPGRLGAELEADEGKASARAACVTVLVALHHELGTLDRVDQILRVTGYVRAVPEFVALPPVLDGASELLVDVFGDRGRHARSAIGVSALPGGGSVEVEVLARVRPA